MFHFPEQRHSDVAEQCNELFRQESERLIPKIGEVEPNEAENAYIYLKDSHAIQFNSIHSFLTT